MLLAIHQQGGRGISLSKTCGTYSYVQSSSKVRAFRPRCTEDRYHLLQTRCLQAPGYVRVVFLPLMGALQRDTRAVHDYECSVRKYHWHSQAQIPPVK